MKKTIIFITAMLIAAAAFTGCNSSTDNNTPTNQPSSSKSSTEPTEAVDEGEKKVVYPFENITYTISEESIYPEKFEITFDASDTPLGRLTPFTYFVESANDKEIIIKSRANVEDDDTSEFLSEYNFTVEDNEYTFTIDVSELKTNFISEDYISGDNKFKITSAMQNFIDASFKVQEDAEYQSVLDELGIQTDNPDYIAQEEQEKEEFEKAKEESQKLKFELVEMYAILSSSTEYKIREKKISSEIQSYTDTSSFEDKKMYINKGTIEFFNPYMYSAVLAIFKSSQNEFFAIRLYNPIFDNGEVTDESLNYMELCKMFTGEWIYSFETKEEAYKCGTISQHGSDTVPHKYYGDSDDTEYKVVEIPLL
ncbi:MAG: hypothetical protein IKJ60_03075 [Ruminococcus sp.]|nr:hypothetical protein [Ruminococcus sp.]